MRRKQFITIFFLILYFFAAVSMSKGSSKITIYEGWLSAYAKEPTDHTLEYRLETGDIQEGYEAYIAVPECNRIGETGVIVLPDGNQKTYQVFDCASRNTAEDSSHAWMTENNIVAELDYYTWKDHGLGRAKLILDN